MNTNTNTNTDPAYHWTDTNPHEAARRRALGSALLDALDGLDDDELLVSLLTLWKKADPSASGAFFAGMNFEDRRAKLAISKLRKPPALSAFWSHCASEDTPLWGSNLTGVLAAQNSCLTMYTGDVPADWARAGRALALSPWAVAIGDALATARPEAVASWALSLAAVGAPLDKARAVARQVKAPGSETIPARDAVLALACQTRDSELFDFAASFADCGPLSPAGVQLCSTNLSCSGHYRARESLGLAKKQQEESGKMVQRLLALFPQPDLARALLSAVCLNQRLLPEQLVDEGWIQARKELSKLGASELGTSDLIALISKASGIENYFVILNENLAEAATRQVLTPRSKAIKEGEAPLEFELLAMLPKLPPKAFALVCARIDELSKNGWPKDTLLWSRARGTITETIGLAIAELPRAKKGASIQFEPLITRWLGALAAQGFNFETKVSPKSRSLGDKLRGAQMKEFWVVVEAKALEATSKSPAPTKRRQSL